jgi:hypothetical protein
LWREGGFNFKETSVFPGSYGENRVAKMAITKMTITRINPPTASRFFLKYGQPVLLEISPELGSHIHKRNL